ncbi:MAG: ABC transporter ATP-binding protein [Spirochaetales bacterium]|nr:MAG: ABC transporter ATP-binding protein [Spirochaetales bacterium]
MKGLETRGLTRQFGGLTAVNSVDFVLTPGEIVGIIGPNGAGKTTFIHLISGVYLPTEGTVHLNGKDITFLPAHERSRLGLSRTFQIIHPLENLNLTENVMVGYLFACGLSRKQAREKAQTLCRELGLDNLERPVDELTVLEIKKMEIAQALATDPSILFLDEIMAGLTSQESFALIDFIRKIAADRNLGIGVVEHVMGVIKELTHSVMVLDAGEVIARGPYEEVARERKVIDAYLGGGA